MTTKLDTISTRLLLCYLFFAPISIAISKILLGVILIIWIWELINCAEKRKQLFHHPLAIPISSFIICTFFSTIAGIDFLNTLPEAIKSALWMALTFAISQILSNQSLENLLLKSASALCAGHVISGLHSILDYQYNLDFFPSPPQPLTESGQLLISSAFIIGVFSTKTHGISIIRPIIVFLTTLLLTFSTQWPHPWVIYTCCFLFFFAIYTTWQYLRDVPIAKKIIYCGTPILIATLIINLKRGPWIGALIAMVLSGFLFKKTHTIIACLTTIVALIAFPPAFERLAEAWDHFVIKGGRMEMWSMGLELLGKFPLGIGADNASYMQEFYPSLPSSHDHFHNNFINTAVETGWLGLITFLWIFIRAIQISLGNLLPWKWSPKTNTETGIGLGIIALFCAGMFECNFSDGEIVHLLSVLLGFIPVITKPSPKQ